MDSDEVIQKAYDLSIEGLLHNSSEYGLLAAAPESFEGGRKNYASLYPRDIGVSSLGMLQSDNQRLITIVKNSLVNLVEAQSPLGQFAFYYKPEKKLVRWWNPGVIDSTLWWAITFLLYYKYVKDDEFFKQYQPNLEKAFVWLTYQDTNNDQLLEQGEASDWADEMPRMGTVLYSNTLWYWLIKLRIEIEGKNELFPLLQKIYEAFNTILWIHKEVDGNINFLPDNDFMREHAYYRGYLEYVNNAVVFLPYYLSYVSHKTYEMRCDSLGNILACLVGLADAKKTKSIMDFFVSSSMTQPFPIKALYPPIYPGEEDWKQYMTKARQNYPWQYHNGGIWPFIGGFYVMLLAKTQPEKAKEVLQQLAKANQVHDWEFNEYLQGQTGSPMGVPHQSWSMGMYLAAYQAVVKNQFVL